MLKKLSNARSCRTENTQSVLSGFRSKYCFQDRYRQKRIVRSHVITKNYHPRGTQCNLFLDMLSDIYKEISKSNYLRPCRCACSGEIKLLYFPRTSYDFKAKTEKPFQMQYLPILKIFSYQEN